MDFPFGFEVSSVLGGGVVFDVAIPREESKSNVDAVGLKVPGVVEESPLFNAMDNRDFMADKLLNNFFIDTNNS